MRFAKGHGTENDFVILPDPDGLLDLPAEFVARLCDRRAGIGADGVLRVVRTKAGGRQPADRAAFADAAGHAEWFMDYRNADGSVAQMCGNGIRVFARYLLDSGLAASGEMTIATRSGPRRVEAEPGGDVTVDMGTPVIHGHGRATVAGRDVVGLRISTGNPHLACVVSDPLADFDLIRPPAVDDADFPDGANVELVRVLGDRDIEMRVHERGSGETRSCGTGAVAAAVAAANAAGVNSGTWTIAVPGGRLRVTLDGQTSLLSGPATIVAEGELTPALLPGS